MFDKEAQRVRALQFAVDRLAAGEKLAVIPPLPPKSVQVPVQPRNHRVIPVSKAPSFVAPVVRPVKVKKEPKVTYIAEAFTNKLGQIINPGDTVLCVTQGYNHSIGTSKGVYLGVRHDSRGRVRSVVVRRTFEKFDYLLNGKIVKWETPGAQHGKYMYTGNTSLPSLRIFPTI